MSESRQEQAKRQALARFADSGPDRLNCAQAVVAFALQIMGHDPRQTVVARYFGGGMAGMGEACGVLTGASMALGIRDCHLPDQGSNFRNSTTGALRALIRDFGSEFGSRRCRELTGCDLSTPEGHKAFKESLAHERCNDYVRWVCDRLAPLLETM